MKPPFTTVFDGRSKEDFTLCRRALVSGKPKLFGSELYPCQRTPITLPDKMDPVTVVGLVASADQLLVMAKDIVSGLYQYFEAVIDAPERSKELRQEITTLCELLESLAAIVTVRNATPSFVPIAESLRTALPEVQQLLTKIGFRITEKKSQGVRRLRWPFTREENDRLLSQIERYKGTINLSLNIQTL